MGGAEPPKRADHQCGSGGVQYAAAPPLDGGRVAVGLLPNFLAEPLAQLEPYGMMILITLLFFLPMLRAQMGLDLNIISRLIGVPAEFIIRAIAQLTGNG